MATTTSNSMIVNARRMVDVPRAKPTRGEDRMNDEIDGHR
jgi:hypothetical protein